MPTLTEHTQETFPHWHLTTPGEEIIFTGDKPTPALVPGESHGQRSLQAAVHGVTECRT